MLGKKVVNLGKNLIEINSDHLQQFISWYGSYTTHLMHRISQPGTPAIKFEDKGEEAAEVTGGSTQNGGLATGNRELAKKPVDSAAVAARRRARNAASPCWRPRRNRSVPLTTAPCRQASSIGSSLALAKTSILLLVARGAARGRRRHHRAARAAGQRRVSPSRPQAHRATRVTSIVTIPPLIIAHCHRVSAQAPPRPIPSTSPSLSSPLPSPSSPPPLPSLANLGASSTKFDFEKY
jgi:hypothetical protein